MKLTLQLQLLPDDAQAASLQATLERFNEAANWLAGHAFELRTTNQYALHALHYRELRDRFGLSSQMAVRCLAQVCEVYKRDKTIRPTFRAHAAMPYDERISSFKGVDRASLLTLTGRVLVPFVMGQYQRERFGFVRGQRDLVLRRDGRWFLLVTVDLPDGTPLPSTDFLGVDLGVSHLVTDSDGDVHSGAGVEAVRVRLHTRKQKLQRAGAARKKRGRRPKNLRRALRRMNRREARFRKHVNHTLARRLVNKAKGRCRPEEQTPHLFGLRVLRQGQSQDSS